MMRVVHVVVDNSEGGDGELAEAITRALADQGLSVELRRPSPGAIFDTAVHLISVGLTLRVSERPDPGTLAVLAATVKDALRNRTSLRRRTRSVPVHLGETARVVEWIDLFD
jgi:hypothetical protein